MLSFGPLAFTAPWLLAGLVALPVLWLLLRAVPPAPVRRRFPGVVLLLGLADDESQSDKTPWWLLLLRMLAVAALILAFAGPVLNPQSRAAGSGPLLVLLDGTWADARDWSARIDRVDALLTEAGRAGRPVAVAVATDLPPGGPQFQSANAVQTRLAGLAPAPWAPARGAVADWIAAAEEDFDTVWLSDGLAREGRAATRDALAERGVLRVLQSGTPLVAMQPPAFEGGAIAAGLVRRDAAGPATFEIVGRGLDPGGVERDLARAEIAFDADARQAEVNLSLPPELRNRITRFEIAGVRSAGAVSLTDDALRRREVALIAGREDREGLELLSPLHYLKQALAPSADLIDGALMDILQANPDVIVFADVARVTETETEALVDWMERGGLLVRFAGPRLAASDVAVGADHPLMPVRLRAGGRSVGGAMSWGEPKRLQAFPEASPFHGLDVPDEVEVTAQVLAQPDAGLADATIASLSDGTPLVTRKIVGEGQVVLFHVSANAEWSSLPLSGLFVEMLERLAVSSRTARPSAAALEGTTWQAESVLDAFGSLRDSGDLAGVAGARIAKATPGPDMPPGLYTSGDRSLAVNVVGAQTELRPAAWPDGTRIEGLGVAEETRLAGFLLTGAVALGLADIIAALALSGRLGLRGGALGARAAVTLVLSLAVVAAPAPLRAQDAAEGDEFAVRVTSDVVLAHVRTGDAEVDRVALAGLRGISRVLTARTSIEPAEPVTVDLETDELAFFPFLYWPVAPNQPLPSPDAYSRLNDYLRSGGMILFDTRDADLGGFGAETPEGRKLQQLARPLDIPPLEPLPQDHVLTRTFYLLQDFPGRYANGQVWVEAAPEDAARVEGMPFRDLNDGVTPVVIGGNDWAAAWAVDEAGERLLPVGSGYAGERQRELAHRFGVNLIMHVLTGNYKSDQVHVPALLDRLGQ